MAWVDVEITQDLEIVHSDSEFALWSDGHVTGPVYGVPFGGPLSADAVTLMKQVCNADLATVEGDLQTLARVGRIVNTEPMPPGTLGPPRDKELVERIEILWTNGEPGVLYSCFRGHFEGYDYHIYQSLEALRSSLEGRE